VISEKRLQPVRTIGFFCTVIVLKIFNLSHLLLDLAPSVVRRLQHRFLHLKWVGMGTGTTHILHCNARGRGAVSRRSGGVNERKATAQTQLAFYFVPRYDAVTLFWAAFSNQITRVDLRAWVHLITDDRHPQDSGTRSVDGTCTRIAAGTARGAL